MEKIPTLFVRDPENPKRVTCEVTPGCEWVIAGEGQPTRKYDGTCVMLDDCKRWWARREVKPGKTPPPNYWPLSTDPNTGKTVGWEPIEQSAFAKYHAEALYSGSGLIRVLPYGKPTPGTYELIGFKINGNPEKIEGHLLVRHGYEAHSDPYEFESLTNGNIFRWLWDHKEWEGVVWHHPDGRMAKLKRRDVYAELLGA